MDAPHYSVAVTVGGVTLTSIHGEVPDPTDPVHLADGLTYSWAWQDGQIPGQLEPRTVTFGLFAADASTLPPLALGARCIVTVYVGVTSIRIVRFEGRLTAVPITLVPGSDWPVRVQITAVDLTTDPRSTNVEPGAVLRDTWSEELAFRFNDGGGAAGGGLRARIGRPNWWNEQEDNEGWMRYAWDGGNALDVVHQLLASYAPLGIHHALAVAHGPLGGYPAGYAKMQADPDDLRTLRDYVYLAVPAGREFFGAHGLPFVLTTLTAQTGGANAGKVGVVVSQTPAAINRLPVVDAAWCRVPATASLSREHSINRLQIGGETTDMTAGSRSSGNVVRDTSYVETSPDVIGPIPRAVDTALVVQVIGGGAASTVYQQMTAAQLDLVARVHLPDTVAAGAGYAFDEFEVHASLMPQAVAQKLLPLFGPSIPGDGGDGQLVRHMTLHNLPAHIQIDGRHVLGFLASGTLTIERGELIWRVRATPGVPHMQPSTGSITVAQVAASYPSVKVSDLSPDLAVYHTRLTRQP